MNIKSVGLSLVAAMLLLGSAAAANPVLEGVVQDARGRPIAGATVQIESKDGDRVLSVAKTDRNGRYTSEPIGAGTYRVTLIVNGVRKTSINNATLEPDQATKLNFALTQTRSFVTVKKGIHRVWIPAFTGSRLPGRWVEIDDGGAWAAEATANNVVRVSGEELQRTVHSVGIKRGQ